MVPCFNGPLYAENLSVVSIFLTLIERYHMDEERSENLMASLVLSFYTFLTILLKLKPNRFFRLLIFLTNDDLYQLHRWP